MNKAKLKEFIDKFEKFLKKHPESKLDMENPYFKGCGSPACFGGWMRAVLGGKHKVKYKREYWFKYGAGNLAQFLGLRSEYGLENWLLNNPEIWGNVYGGEVFLQHEAFSEGAKKFNKNNPATLKDVLHKWKRVLKRLEEKESKK